MNVAVIIAGGSGSRMGQDILKQFINLYDKHVLTDVIVKAQQYGDAAISLPYNEQIFVVSEDDLTTTTQYIPRET